MKIPDHLQPHAVSNRLGISLGDLALRLQISYHTLHGWARRGTAPPHTIRFLEVEVPRVEAAVREERAAMEPEEALEAATRVPPRPQPQGRRLPPGVRGLVRRQGQEAGEE